MADINDPRPVLRQELARIFKNQRVILAFEKIFDLIPTDLIAQQVQIDQLIVNLGFIADEVSQSSELSAIREQLVALNQKIEGLQQGPII